MTQLLLEEGNLSSILPAHLSKWLTGKVRQEGVTVLSGSSVSTVALSGDDRVKVFLSDGKEVSKVDLRGGETRRHDLVCESV